MVEYHKLWDKISGSIEHEVSSWLSNNVWREIMHQSFYQLNKLFVAKAVREY